MVRVVIKIGGNWKLKIKRRKLENHEQEKEKEITLKIIKRTIIKRRRGRNGKIKIIINEILIIRS